MRTVVNTIAAGVRLTPYLERRVQELVEMGLYTSVSEFLREAIREKLGDFEVVELRDLPYEDAKQEILAFIKRKGRAWTSEIADALRLDLDVVVRALSELSEEGEVR